MKATQLIMGMPITVDITDSDVAKETIDNVFDYFRSIDERFSPYKKDSEVSRINRNEIQEKDYSEDIKTVLQLSEQTKKETNGYFDIKKDGKIDPSGLVKGWAIYNASLILIKAGIKNFYIDAGGDVQVSGKNHEGKDWVIGIKNPFNAAQIIKIVHLDNRGIATSGTYMRGNHIYTPYITKNLELKTKNQEDTEVVSLTVIGPNVYEADRFATAAFAMGRQGIYFIEKLPGFEGYMIDKKGIATMTSEFKNFVQ